MALETVEFAITIVSDEVVEPKFIDVDPPRTPAAADVVVATPPAPIVA